MSDYYEINAKQIRFICEQDGIPERELKSELRKLFTNDEAILRAYLVQITCSTSHEAVVGLCLSVASGNESKRVKEISNIFSQMFTLNQHLEIIFLDDELETKVAAVCEPFYVKP